MLYYMTHLNIKGISHQLTAITIKVAVITVKEGMSAKSWQETRGLANYAASRTEKITLCPVLRNVQEPTITLKTLKQVNAPGAVYCAVQVAAGITQLFVKRSRETMKSVNRTNHDRQVPHRCLIQFH